MDKKQQKSDKSLADVYKSFENDPNGQELQFLNAAFDFLNRRSTYLAIPGSSTKVIQMVHHHIDTAKKNEIQNQNLNQKKTSGTSIPQKTSKPIPETEQKTTKSTPQNDDSKKQYVDDKKTTTKPDIDLKSDHKTNKMDIDSAANSNTIDMDAIDSDSAGEIPEGNGGKTDKYVWTQSLSDVELSLEIDANLRGKHLKIVIGKKKLFVAIKGKENSPIIDGVLHAKINTDESTWTLDKEHGKKTKTLTIILTKIKGMTWWKRVMVGDAEIDTSKIQPENSKLDTLDRETRQTVEKMMFDQRQKMKGLPTTKEIEQQKMLAKFKAQHPEMDFSNLKMAPDSMNSYAQK